MKAVQFAKKGGLKIPFKYFVRKCDFCGCKIKHKNITDERFCSKKCEIDFYRIKEKNE